MNIKEIISDIYYCGVNDRTTHRFEALWPIPDGVSYNSYIVRGEKIALIDSVELGEARTLMENIREIIGDAKIDYLVVNHMEPDHSGTIPVLLEHYPEMKIIGNRQTIGMIGGFYHITDPEHFIEVKDGEEISLGSLTLKFMLTPMVHWPETMMTYVAERKTLFTGDAFGCFGALNGAVVDTEMCTERYFPEMYRYYSNIVGKYGRFVQRALAKVKPLEIDYICPTHGPVWHEQIARVADIYNRLSLYESEPGVVIIYGSMYGNTADVADHIASALSSRGVKNIIMHNASHSNPSYMISDAFRYEGLIVGAPTYSMRLFPPVKQFMEAMATREVKEKVFGCFGSFTWASAAAPKIKEYADKMGLTVTASLEMKQSITPEFLAEIEEFADKFCAELTKK